jgi:hypothetical protein
MPFCDRFGVVVVPANRIVRIGAGFLNRHRSLSSIPKIAGVVILQRPGNLTAKLTLVTPEGTFKGI